MPLRLTCLAIFLAAAPLAAQDWKAAKGPLMTRWAKEVSPDNALPEYPRPQMVRERWQNLNGLWDYAIKPKAAEKPGAFDGKILVPFCAESALSGVMKSVGEENRLWYRRSFKVPEDWRRDRQRVLLHFGAVDWRATVWLNGKEVGSHEGGYDPFSFDVTDFLTNEPEGDQVLVVGVEDPTEKGTQPRGKQLSNPHGIWYTPVTGIWQTVWIEPVPEVRITNVSIESDIVRGIARLTVEATGDATVRVAVLGARAQTGPNASIGAESRKPQSAAGKPNAAIELSRLNQRWSPREPWLYEAEVQLIDGGRILDTVDTYFAMRKIEVAKDDQGVNRLFLNGEPLFQFGPLDQGWWPDGLYTAPTDEALRYDIEVTKQLGFNMARKHVKVEPARWYYWCDKLGLMVWQDMPSGDRYIRPEDPDIERSAESEAIYRKEWKAIVESLKNHPSIVCWVPFNEGWGQFKTNEILAFTKELDPTRLVDGPSGWSDRGGGDMHDAHRYPGPGMFPVESGRASVLGEYGGLGLPLEGHLWKQDRNWGYRSFKNEEELVRAYSNLVRQLPPLIGKGLAAAVYTQTTDVEIEVNGLMSYDRAVIKLPPEKVAAVNKTVYAPAPREVALIPTSEEQPQTWRYTTQDPGDGWQVAAFDDSSWQRAPGGFGTEGTPGAIIRTKWESPAVWLRRTVELPEKLHGLALRIHHDEDTTVYLNGQEVASIPGYTTEYVLVPLGDEAAAAAKPGENVLAVQCKQTGGGQYIDVGLVDLVPAKK